MGSPEKFINWLEGYLDACKNTLSPNQVREIRKKLVEVKKESSNLITPLYDSATSTYSNNPIVNEEFIRAIEENKHVSTLEELTSAE